MSTSTLPSFLSFGRGQKCPTTLKLSSLCWLKKAVIGGWCEVCSKIDLTEDPSVNWSSCRAVSPNTGLNGFCKCAGGSQSASTAANTCNILPVGVVTSKGERVAISFCLTVNPTSVSSTANRSPKLSRKLVNSLCALGGRFVIHVLSCASTSVKVGEDPSGQVVTAKVVGLPFIVAAATSPTLTNLPSALLPRQCANSAE